MPPIDILQLLSGLNTNTPGVPEAGAHLVAQENLDQTIQRLLGQAGPQMPEPADASVGPLRGIIAGLADAFQNKARGMAPNPGGISQGNALDTLTALRQRQAQREDRQNFAQFRADSDRSRRDTTIELGAAQNELARTRDDRDRANQIRRDNELLARDEKNRREAEDRAAARGLEAEERENVRREADAGRRRKEVRESRQFQLEVMEIQRNQHLADLRNSVIQTYTQGGLQFEEGLTMDEIHQSAGEQLASKKQDKKDEALSEALRVERTAATGDRMVQLADAVPEDLTEESAAQWRQRVHRQMAGIWGEDEVGLSNAMRRFDSTVYIPLVKRLRLAEAEQLVQGAPGTGRAFLGNMAAGVNPITSVKQISGGVSDILSELFKGAPGEQQ